jgi:RNA polymerase sigma-70 factor, ECF subfamily
MTPSMSVVNGDDSQRLAREDADLVARIAAGDHGAPIAELYRRYAGRVYGLALRLLGDPGLAEEVVQESFLRLWRTAARYDPARGSVGAYMFVIARSVAADVRRRPSSRVLTSVDDVPEPAAEDGLDQLTEALVVREALDSLSPAHRQVLTLAYDGGLTQTQIAARLSLPLGTVKTRMFHGLRALRAALVEREFDV